MRLKKYEHISYLIFIIFLLSFFTFGCEKYQSESFEISTKDAQACAQIQDTLYNSVNTVRLTTYDSTWTDDNVSQNVPDILDSLKESGIVVSEDDLSTWITTIAGVDTNYVCFQTNLSSVVLYSDRIVRLKLMDAQGEFRSISSLSMPLETVGGCLTETGNPQIKTRLEYSTPDDEYLLYIINEETTFPSDEEDFIIILSIL